MISNEQQVRAAIAEQAGHWLVVNDEGPLSARDAEELSGWLTASPVHVEEFLGVSVVARDLRAAAEDAEFSVAAVLADARSAHDTTVQPIRPRLHAPVLGATSRRWLTSAVAMAAMVVLVLGLLSLWNAGLIGSAWAPGETTARYETRHGEQRTLRLTDNSVLRLNTDSAVTIRYGKSQRLITLASGEAEFDVVHDAGRPFRVFAGSAEVVDIGTKFNVRLDRDATVITVIEGRVAIGPAPIPGAPTTGSGRDRSLQFVDLGADQQLTITRGEWPVMPASVDAQRTTSWLRRQIVFEQEPLDRVAAEFNRYGPKPIEIITPALRDLHISGVFATDDTGAFIAFLRSLKGVRVEESASQIRVSRSPGLGASDST